MKSLSVSYVDAFTNRPFSGNPAAVTLLEKELSERAMQNVALELNLSETAFLFFTDGKYQIRWFTPNSEVELCGHATLASAHFLWEKGIVRSDEIHFSSCSGPLRATQMNGKVKLDFPSEPPIEVTEKRDFFSMLGVEPLYVGKNRMDYVVELPDENAVKGCVPDLKAVCGLDRRGLIITAKSLRQYDFVSRCFYPALNINEDPVTGSAHCALASYWAKKLGKNTFKAFQASQRGGELEVHLRGDRVDLIGDAITTVDAQILVPLE